MDYDLNFWPDLDWQRESSMDPRFQVGVIFVLVIISLFGAWSWSYGRRLKIHSTQMQIEARVEHLKLAALDVQRQQDCIEYWRGMEGQVLRKQERRMSVSNQMQAWAMVVPGDICFRNISLSSVATPVDAVVVVGGKKGGPFLRYEVQFQGTTAGVGMEQVITRFKEELPMAPALRNWIEKSDLSNMNPASDAASGSGTTFTIRAVYKPLDWFDESKFAPTAAVRGQ